MTAHLTTGLLSILLLSGPVAGQTDDNETARATAPAGADVFETTFEGTWFVDRDLKLRYRSLLEAVEQLDQRVQQGSLRPAAARREIASLREELLEVRQQIDEQKTLVNPFTIVTQTAEGTIELGQERLLVVTGDRLRLIGWDGPHVRYEVTKRVLSVEKPVEDHLAGIRVVHQRRIAPDLVGKTDAEMDAWRDEYLAPKDGEGQTAEQLEQKKQNWNRNFAHGERWLNFVGRKVDEIHLEGLTWQEGNQHLSYEITRPEGGGQMGGRWRRSADVTLYVPPCTAVLLRGCEQSVDVTGLHARLMMTSQGSQDRNFNGTFSIRDHHGDVTLRNVPIDLIRDVAGSIEITATTEMVNTGSHHREDWVLHTPAPRELSISGVTGDVTAEFTRSRLSLTDIAGIVNVTNHYGATRWNVETALAGVNHRVVSRSGLVRVDVSGESGLGTPVFAATNCGTLVTNLGRKWLTDLHSVHDSHRDHMRREWRSLRTHAPGEDVHSSWKFHQRPDQILEDEQRSHGVDLLSVAGRVEYRHTDSENR